MEKHILNLAFHICDVGKVLFFSLKTLSNELGALMMRIADGRFACNIMNAMHRHDVDSM